MADQKRAKLSTRSLALGVVSGAAAAGLAPAVAQAATSTIWYNSACCNVRHYGNGHYGNYSANADLTNWHGTRHNAGIHVCAQGYNKTSKHYLSYNCASAYYTAAAGIFPQPYSVQGLCWTGSTNTPSGNTPHFMFCDDTY